MLSFKKIVNALFGDNPSNIADEDISKTTLTFVEKHDPEMEAARQAARDSVSQFIQKLSDPEFATCGFFVKKRFEQDGTTEHIWLSDTRVEGDEFVGLVGNDPQLVNHIKCGDEARVAFSDIGDWMIYQGDDMIGGFTVELLMKRRS